MIKSLIEMRKKALKNLTLFSPVLTIIIVYYFKINIAGYFALLSPTLKADLVSKPALGFAVNSALIVLIINIIIERLKHPGEFKIEMKNNSRKSDSYFDVRTTNHRPVLIHLDCTFNFKNTLIYWLVRKLGGVTLNVTFPHWIDYKIENKKDLKDSVLTEQKKEFQIDIEKALQKKKVSLPMYIKLSILSNSFDINNGSIVSSIELKSSSKVARFLLYLIIALFFDIKIADYEVEARADIN